MLRFALAAVVLLGGSALAKADDGPFQLIGTQFPQAVQSGSTDAAVTTVAYRYYRGWYGPYGYPRYGYGYGTGYRGYYGGYYRPYYTRGWRDGYALPLGRRWGAF